MVDASRWTVETLKEYFEQVLVEKDKALSAALIAVKEETRKTELAAEKRFELLNELRSGVATKDQVAALEKVVDGLKERIDLSQGKGAGLTAGWGYVVAGATVLIALAAFLVAFASRQG